MSGIVRVLLHEFEGVVPRNNSWPNNYTRLNHVVLHVILWRQRAKNMSYQKIAVLEFVMTGQCWHT